MKRLFTFCILLSLLLSFSGCQKRKFSEETQPVETTAAPTVPTTISTEAPTQPITPTTLAEPSDEEFVRILDYIPTASQALAYATDQNFTGQTIYGFAEAYLRYGTVKKLMLVSEELAGQGLYLKIWDGFRPVSAQFKLWQIYPDPTYVANPEKGYSSHSRGNTVDLTLVDGSGQELTMPTGFDDFSALANRDYSDCPEAAAANAMLLQETMEKYGFSGYYGEWWHFSDVDSYPVEKIFQPPVG